jgi:hypothetical protein
MTTLASVSIGTGVVYLALSVPLLACAAWAQGIIKGFPRHVWAGRILAAPALAWAVFLVREMPLGWFDAYKGWLYMVGPLLYVLIVIFMEELLAARALGGLLLLVAGPVLEASNATNAAGCSWRLVLVALAYTWVIAGMALMLAPWRFRKTMEVLCATVGRCRAAGAIGSAIGVGLILLALTAFRG